MRCNNPPVPLIVISVLLFIVTVVVMIFVNTNPEYARQSKTKGKNKGSRGNYREHLMARKRERDGHRKPQTRVDNFLEGIPGTLSPSSVHDKPVHDNKPVRGKPVRGQPVRNKPVHDRSMACIGPPVNDAVCTTQYQPVLGCDGKMFSNKCRMAAAGVAYAHPEYTLVKRIMT